MKKQNVLILALLASSNLLMTMENSLVRYGVPAACGAAGLCAGALAMKHHLDKKFYKAEDGHNAAMQRHYTTHAVSLEESKLEREAASHREATLKNQLAEAQRSLADMQRIHQEEMSATMGLRVEHARLLQEHSSLENQLAEVQRELADLKGVA